MGKIRLLYVGDYSNTGFGTVAKGLLRGLHKTDKYDITQVGINVSDEDRIDDPWKVLPASDWAVEGDEAYATDPFGYKRMKTYVENFDPDIVFINNDFPVAKLYLEDKKGKPTYLANHRSVKVLYAPVDSEPVPPLFAEVALMYDLTIAYSDWQRQMMAEHDPLFAFMPILYHGYNDSALKPLDKAQARSELAEIFAKYNDGVSPDDFKPMLEKAFLIYFVGTNQFRKDIPCLFRAVALLQEEVPNAYLIPQTNAVPKTDDGWILTNLQGLTGLKNAVLMKRANIFTEEEMNVMYNAADVLAYPTRGEGFGLPSLEAMAVKTPVVATRFGPQEELHKDGRGYFIDIRDVIPGMFGWTYFVLPDHRSLYKQLKFVHDNPEHAKETAERAYEWAKDMTWDNQALELDQILSRIPRQDGEVLNDSQLSSN
jgi:glycosyltransferase involved in cell wall biosynthesis